MISIVDITSLPIVLQTAIFVIEPLNLPQSPPQILLGFFIHLIVYCWLFPFANLVDPKGAVFWLWVLFISSVHTSWAVETRTDFQQLCCDLFFPLVLLPAVE